jgi:hypothetical protein
MLSVVKILKSGGLSSPILFLLGRRGREAELRVLCSVVSIYHPPHTLFFFFLLTLFFGEDLAFFTTILLFMPPIYAFQTTGMCHHFKLISLTYSLAFAGLKL